MKTQTDLKLTRLKPEFLEELKSKFKINWPEHIVEYNTINNAIQRYKKLPQEAESIKIYTLGDSWKENGTFVARLYEEHLEVNIFLGTLDTSLESLKFAVEQIDFTSKVYFKTVREIYQPIVLRIIADKGKVLTNDAVITIYVDRETVEKMTLEIPEDYEVKSLIVENAKKINSCWPNQSEGSEKFIADMIKSNMNIGIFHKDGELAAWCLQHDSGSLQALQTDANHLRKGLGTLAVKAICKKIVEKTNSDITANVLTGNQRALELFTKLGFCIIEKRIAIKASQ